MINNDKLKAMIRELLEPVFESITEQSFKVFKALNDNLKDVPDDQREHIIKDIIIKTRDGMINNITKGIPTDLEAKLKEAANK